MDNQNLQKVFTDIADKNLWESSESKSGPGSTLEQTRYIRSELPAFLMKHRVKTVLDIPCGDFHWMRLIKKDLAQVIDQYIGGDIVSSLVDQNNKEYADEKFRFEHLDLTNSALPTVDLIFSRDVLVHLSYENILKALRKIKKSHSRYLLTTSFIDSDRLNQDIITGQWRPLNLRKPPFYFPVPLEVLVEQCTENEGIYQDKSLALFEIKKIKLMPLYVFILFKKMKAIFSNG